MVKDTLKKIKVKDYVKDTLKNKIGWLLARLR